MGHDGILHEAPGTAAGRGRELQSPGRAASGYQCHVAVWRAMAAVGLHHGHHLFGAADRGLVLESVSASGQMNAKTKVAAMVAAGTLALASPALMNFLGKWEGEGQNTVYPDRLADHLPTVCQGITKHTSPYPVVLDARKSVG